MPSPLSLDAATVPHVCQHDDPIMVCVFCHHTVDTDYQYCPTCKEGPGRVEWFCEQCEMTAENMNHNDINHATWKAA